MALLSSVTSIESPRRLSAAVTWNRQAEGLGGLEVDDQLEARSLLDGEIGWLRPAEESIHVQRGLSVQRREIGRVTHQPTIPDKLAANVKHRDQGSVHVLQDCPLVDDVPRIRDDQQRAGALDGDHPERGLVVPRRRCLDDDDLDPDPRRGNLGLREPERVC